jgi:hypothetical protein
LRKNFTKLDLSPIDEQRSRKQINWNLTPINLLGVFAALHYPLELANFSPSPTLKEAP